MSDWKVGDRGRLTADFTVTQVKSNVWVRFDSFTHENSFSGAAMTEENGVTKITPPYVPQIGDYAYLAANGSGVLRRVRSVHGSKVFVWHDADGTPEEWFVCDVRLGYRPEVPE